MNGGGNGRRISHVPSGCRVDKPRVCVTNLSFAVTPGKEQERMSMHRSLKSASKIAARRNVLKRYERVDLLKKVGRWNEGDRAYGLPKTKPED